MDDILWFTLTFSPVGNVISMVISEGTSGFSLQWTSVSSKSNINVFVMSVRNNINKSIY